jgi:pSer/pThr/pTyr-binding forkhead associated (FHA) protein
MPPVGSGRAPDLGAGEAVLVVQRGMGAGTSYLLVGDLVTAGREPDSDLFLDDVTVSRRHAELRRMASGWLLRDVGSLNGTYVNRRRIEETPLSPGDEVQIGKYRFAYLVGEDTGSGS